MDSPDITPTETLNESSLECPICMDPIDVAINCSRTECGHCFHTKCLMHNVSVNGFDCPYCRTVMAETVSDDDDDEENRDDVSFDNTTIDDSILNEDDILRGFRLFINNLEGQPHSDDDVDAEINMPGNEFTPNFPKPTPAYVTAQLLAQGVSMEQLVKILLCNHNEYDDEEDEFLQLDDDIFGKMRIIISNYSEESTEAIATEIAIEA